MTLDTNDSIRYLMNEMDPSEAIHYERQLEENPDLRIDLESMRRADERMQAVPFFSAPSQLLNEVVSFASQKALYRKRQHIRKRTLQAAAVITIALVPSIYFLSDETQFQSPEQVADSQKTSPWVDQNENIKLAVTGVNAIGNSMSTQSAEGRSSSVNNASSGNPSFGNTTAGNVSPTFFLTLESERVTQQAGGVLDSIYRESFQKLRPIQQTAQTPSMARDLQLTRSVRN